MNIVRAKRLGQFPGEGIASDITLGPQDTIDSFPMYYDPGLLIAEQGAPAPAPAATVPQPPATDTTGQTGFLPYQMTITPVGVSPATAAIPAPGAISPAPRVNVPTTSILSSLQAPSLGGLPLGAWLGIGLIGFVFVLGSGGKGRRR